MAIVLQSFEIKMPNSSAYTGKVGLTHDDTFKKIFKWLYGAL